MVRFPVEQFFLKGGGGGGLFQRREGSSLKCKRSEKPSLKMIVWIVTYSQINKKYRSICYLSLPFRNLSLIATRCCNSPTFLFNAVISSSFSVATFSLKEKNNTKPRAQRYYFREPYVKLRERKTKLLLTGFCPWGHILHLNYCFNFSSSHVRAKYLWPF